MGYSKKGNYFTLHGQVHEGLALGKYKEQTGCRVGQYGLITCPDEPWLGCSPDGVTHCGKLVEIKCPVTRLIVPGEVPRHYLPQLQISMHILGLESADFFEWQQGQTNLVNVKRDQAYIDAMLPKLRAFYTEWQTLKREGRKPKRKRKVDHPFI